MINTHQKSWKKQLEENTKVMKRSSCLERLIRYEDLKIPNKKTKSQCRGGKFIKYFEFFFILFFFSYSY